MKGHNTEADQILSELKAGKISRRQRNGCAEVADGLILLAACRIDLAAGHVAEHVLGLPRSF